MNVDINMLVQNLDSFIQHAQNVNPTQPINSWLLAYSLKAIVVELETIRQALQSK